MHESNSTAAQLHEKKRRSLPRLFHPPLISLIYAALVWTLAALGLVRYPQGGGDLPDDRGAADLGELTSGRPAIKGLTAAELDERAPLSPQESAQFGPGKGDRTARRVLQATILLTQGGARERFMSAIAALVGVCVRTVQRHYNRLEERGLSRRRLRKKSPAWNLPNLFRFLLRERQLQIFFQNVAQRRRILNLETKAHKNGPSEAAGVWKTCRARPSNHPPEVRAAWEARRRANHPPEMRQRYEEKAAFYDHMRGWRPTAAAKTAAIVRRASSALIGAGFESEEHRAAATIAAAVRMGLSNRAAKRLASTWAAELAELPPAISWAELDEPRELVVVATLQLRPRPQAL
jgi:transposase